MPAYEDLIETGGRGTSWALVAVYCVSFVIILTAFVVTLSQVAWLI